MRGFGFKSRFNFQKDKTLLVGVERERFVSLTNGEIVPKAKEVLDVLGHNRRFGYELSACQIEDRVGPIDYREVLNKFYENDQMINRACAKLGYRAIFQEVAPTTMPLEVYPDPTGRYQKMVKSMPREVLDAACRVTGTHVHVGMPDHKTALRVYNNVVGYTDALRELGDHSRGERHRLYQIVAPHCCPPIFNNWREFKKTAKKGGYHKNPRDCWHYVRLTIHGTIEFRVFGSTSDNVLVEDWVRACYELCAKHL